jgi:uncharacterized protein (DUF1501 family)
MEGLTPADLYQERDLAVTTDFREPIGLVLRAHLGLPANQMDRIFPRYRTDSDNTGGLINV